jgi:hypothetical protein
MRVRCFEALKHLGALPALNALTDPSPGVSWVIGFRRMRSAPDGVGEGRHLVQVLAAGQGWTFQRRIFAVSENAEGGDTATGSRRRRGLNGALDGIRV